jgi:hypothetical protein
MRVFNCTVLDRPTFGDRRPVVTDGVEWTREIQAETAGKARYHYWREVHEYWETVAITDIRVRVSKRAERLTPEVRARIETANQIIRVIGSFGRRFLSSNSDRRNPDPECFFAHFRFDRGELWYIERYSRKPIAVRLQDWPGFSDGGTLRGIIEHLAKHITYGAPINLGYFSRGPKWMSGDGDYWGYGEDIDKVTEGVREIVGGA